MNSLKMRPATWYGGINDVVACATYVPELTLGTHTLFPRIQPGL